ncbi:MAG: hypothetical protein Fur0043_22280 [Anaerolineales bacterium]
MHLSEEQVNQYLDGLLEASAQQEFEAHLVACANCRRYVDELQALFAGLATLPDLPLPHDLTPRILARLPQKAIVPPRTRSLAAQWGLVTGFALWLGMQMTIIVELPALLLPNITLPALRLPALQLDILPDQFPMPQIPISQPLTFDFQTPSFFLPFSPAHLILLLALAALPWVMGNVILMRSRPEVRK